MNRKSLFTLFCIVATELMGFGLIVPVLAQISVQYGADGIALGILLSSYSFAQFIAAPILGALSDRYGRKPMLIYSQIGTVASLILLAFSQSYWPLLISRLVDGFSGGNISIARAYVSDVTTKEDRPRGMAVIGIAFGVGFVLGPALGGFLFTQENQHSVPALIAAGFSTIALLQTIFFLPEPEQHHGMVGRKVDVASFFRITSRTDLFPIFATHAIYMIVFSGFTNTFALFSEQRFGYTARENSFVFVYVGVLMLIIQGIIIHHLKGNIRNVTFLGLMTFVAGIIATGLASNAWMLLGGLALFALGSGTVASYLPSLLSTSDEKDPEGEVMGVFEGVGGLSNIIGPLLAGGIMLNLVQQGVGYIFFAIVMFACTIISIPPKRST